MKITDDHEVGEVEQITRFIAGAVFGLIPAALLYALAAPSLAGIAALLSVACVLVAGVLALFLGDRFWQKVVDLLHF